MDYEIGFDPSLMIDYNFDDGLFTILYDVKEALTQKKINEILRLINEYYAESTFNEDYYIKANRKMLLDEYIEYYFVHRSGVTNEIGMNIPVFIQALDGRLFRKFTKQVGIEFICDEFDGSLTYGIKVYPYVYFDSTTINKKGERVDQRKAAKKNREILRKFLIELEEVIGAKGNDISCGHSYLEKYIYKYGVREGAEYLL